MPVESWALTSYSDLKDAFDIPSDSKQSFYESLINEASAMCNSITGRNLKQQSYSVTLDGTGSSKILLPQYPVTSISRVEIDKSRAFDGSGEVPSSDYGVYSSEGIVVLYESTFPLAPLVVQVDFDGGYDPVPHDLKAATYEIVEFLKDRRSNDRIGKKTINIDTGISENYELSVPLNAMKILQEYKRRDSR